jgi:hypothetical protein
MVGFAMLDDGRNRRNRRAGLRNSDRTQAKRECD